MFNLSRIKPSQDPLEKITMLSLQQLAEDMRINEKRVRALEKSIMALRDVLVGSSSEGQHDLVNVTEPLQDLHEEIRAWSKQSLNRAEELTVVVRKLVSDQELDAVVSCPTETKRQAS